MSEKIYVSPSDQGKNEYGAGNTNEKEVCGKISVALVKALERCKFEAKTNLTASMQERVRESNEWGAAIHLPLHTNAFNAKVAGTRLFCYELGGEGYKACMAVMDTLAPITPGTSDAISARPELYEVRAAAAPTVYVEVDFHDVPDVALWIIEHTEEIAEAITKGICNYFGKEYVAPDAGTPEKEPEIPETRNLEERVAELENLVAGLMTSVELLADAVGKRYHSLGDVRADENNAANYLPTLELLIDMGYLKGKGGAGDAMILDLSEDAVRLLVVLDRAGVFGGFGK